MEGKTKILIVEDENIISLDLKFTLENAGYIVVGIARTSEEAVEKSEETDPDLILMDIILKGIGTGIDAAKIIRGEQNIPIIYLTAFSSLELQLRDEDKTDGKFLLKPISNEKLLAAIKEVEKDKIDEHHG